MKLEDVCVIWEKLSLDLAWIGQEDMVVINHLSVCSVDQWRPGQNGNLHLREQGMRPSGRMQFKEHAMSQLGPGPRRGMHTKEHGIWQRGPDPRREMHPNEQAVSQWAHGPS